MRKSRWVIIMMLIVGFMVGQNGLARAAEPPVDVAIVTLVNGDVTYQSGQQTPLLPVAAFMKLCRDDSVTLPEGAQLKLIFTQNGRQELWAGPVALKLGETESQPQGELTAQPQVENLTKSVKSRIVSVTLPFDGERLQKTGGTTVRGSDDPQQDALPTPTPLQLTTDDLAKIESAKAKYAEMRKQSAPNDFTPELYLLGVFDYYNLYAEMQTLTTDLLRQQPDNPFLKAWGDWAKQQTNQ